MKKLLTISFLLCLLGCGETQREMTVKGKITGFEEGTLILLMGATEDGNGFLPVDSAFMSANGEFELTTQPEKPEKFVLIVEDGYDVLAYKDFYGAPGKTITITGEHFASAFWWVESDVQEQIDENVFAKAIHDLMYRMEENIAEMKVVSNEFEEAADEEAKNLLREKYNKLEALDQELRIETDRVVLRTVKENPNIEAAMRKLSELAVGTKDDEHLVQMKEELKKAYEMFPQELQATDEGRKAYNLLYYPPAQEGEPMIDGEFKDMDGNTVKLADFKEDGKYIILDFWASWCGPCNVSIPELREFAEKNKEIATVIWVSIDEKVERWKESTKKLNIAPSLYVGANTAVVTQYGLGVPHVALISPEGIVLKNGWWYPSGKFEEVFFNYINQ